MKRRKKTNHVSLQEPQALGIANRARKMPFTSSLIFILILAGAAFSIPGLLNGRLLAAHMLYEQEWERWKLSEDMAIKRGSFAYRFYDRLSYELSDSDAKKLRIDVDTEACSIVTRVGNLGDGGWDVCEDHIVALKPSTSTQNFRNRNTGQKFLTIDPRHSDPCVVYSVGINHDTSFDVDFVQRYPWCTVYAFDPSIMRETGEDFGEKIKFFNIGLGAEDLGVIVDSSLKFGMRDDPNYDGWSMMRLTTMMHMLNHSHVDLLKMDIEGSEWLTWGQDCESWPCGGKELRHSNLVTQLISEIHFGNFKSREADSQMIGILQKVRAAGFKVFSRRPNWRFSRPRTIYTGEEAARAHMCQEIGLVSLP